MSWMAWGTSSLLVVSLALYVLFGGADFGAGILDVTLPRPLRERLRNTLAPVWEANHVWLIAVVVLMFVGYPRFYSLALTRLYVPISLALLAILVRGVFFTVRRYDPDPGSLRTLSSWLFRFSSLGAPIFFGFIVGGLLSTHPGTPTSIPSDLSFAAIYLEPWLDGFGAVCGCFVASLFGYVAAVFFYGELEEPAQRRVLASRIYAFFAATFVLGGATLLLGASAGVVPVERAFEPTFLACQLVAGAGVLLLRPSLRDGHRWRLRLIAGAQVLAILGGWFSAQYPHLLRTHGGTLDVAEALAPEVTLLWLVVGFLLVLALVVPLLVVLYRVFAASPST